MVMHENPTENLRKLQHSQQGELKGKLRPLSMAYSQQDIKQCILPSGLIVISIE